MARSAPLARLVQVNRAVQTTVKRLEAEFPGVPAQVIYDKVGDARVDAAKRLPNLSAYSEVLARQAGSHISSAAAANPARS
jgi:hypothetical protein